MKFRIPSSRPSPTPVTPKNQGRANRYMSAQEELDYVVTSANTQYLEAIAVDGIEFQYWRRSKEGKFCTCSDDGRKHNPRTALASDVITEKFDSPRKDSISFNIRGAWERKEEKPNYTQDVFGTEFGKLPPEENGKEKITEHNADLSDEELENDVDKQAMVTMGPDAGIIFGGEYSRCGICFGTGHVGGYSLLHGKREVFDLSSTIPVVEIKGFVINESDKPFSMTSPMDTACSVTWFYEFPTYFDRCLKILTRNNVASGKNIAIEYKLFNTLDAFAPLTIDWINTRKGIPTKVLIRVRPSGNELSSSCIFTHLEIIWQYTKWHKAQMPGLSKSTNFSVFDSIITTEFTLPPTMIGVDKEDIIFENKHYKLWKITDVTDFKTANGQVCGWSANARVVQDYEQVSLLRLIRDNNYEIGHDKLSIFSGINLSNSDKF